MDVDRGLVFTAVHPMGGEGRGRPASAPSELYRRERVVHLPLCGSLVDRPHGAGRRNSLRRSRPQVVVRQGKQPDW
jgi:hypothetical protein